MAIKALVDSLDDVAEGLRGEYEEITEGEHTGKFRLSVDGADSLVDTSGLKGALTRERQKGKLADLIRKEFPNVSDDEIAELVKKAKGATNASGDLEKDPEKIVKKLRKELEDEYTPIRSENETLKGKLRRVLLDDAVKNAALKAGVIPEDVDDVLEITRKRFDLNDKDQVVVLDKEGDPSSVTLEKFFAEAFKKEKPKFYKAPDASGSENGERRRAPAGSKTELDELNKLPPAARLTEARKRGIGTTKT